MEGYNVRVPPLFYNTGAEPVMDLFSTAISKYFCSLHVRTDHGGENWQIREDVKVHRGEPSVLTAPNQRTERLNQDLNKNCQDVFAPIFYELQSSEALDADNETDLFCLPSRDQSQIESWKQHLTVIHKCFPLQGNKKNKQT